MDSMSLASRSERGYICKRDGSLMYLVYESEKTVDNKLRVVISYKCPVCGLKLESESLEIRRDKNFLIVSRGFSRISI
ncbi:hypothetical protein ACSU1N_01775 [Thermogladius sp. 4427co]|uniref:hypothetical protein n=1 Tax=Thermogladius sp. 4427co TaxID=3450718 RepID=UPI003F7A4269